MRNNFKNTKNVLSAFPVVKYPDLDMTVKEDVQLDYNERRDLAKNLLDYSRGKMPDSYWLFQSWSDTNSKVETSFYKRKQNIFMFKVIFFIINVVY